MVTYKQKVKEIARREALAHAVRVLTSERNSSTCARRTYVRDVRDYLLASENPYDSELAGYLSDDHIASWEEFYCATVGSKQPGDLSVCYLSGPEPLNDFRVLVSLGIHPSNIWAFESSEQEYSIALQAVRSSEFPLLKIHKGSVEDFFVNSPKKFDIIYFDACGPLPSSNPSTLRVIATIMRYQRLASPGVLLTNFALPDAKRVEFEYLVGSYLYPKEFLEFEADEDGEPRVTEGAECHGLYFSTETEEKSFINEVKDNFENYYGQFITRQLFDLGLVIAPAVRFFNSSYAKKKLYFADVKHLLACADKMVCLNVEDELDVDDDQSESDLSELGREQEFTFSRLIHGHLASEMGEHPLHWFVSTLKDNEEFPKPPGFVPFSESLLANYCACWRGRKSA